MTNAKRPVVNRYRAWALVGLSVALIVRSVAAYFALANGIPVTALNAVLAIIGAVATLFACWPAALGVHTPVAVASGAVPAVAVLAGLIIEGTVLYPRIMVVDAWMGFLLALGLAVAVTCGALTANSPPFVHGGVAILAMAAAGAIFHRSFGPRIVSWLGPAAVTGILVLVVALFGRLNRTQQIALDSERERGRLSARLAAASAEILDARHREALSLVASGIAHEINNPMTYLRGNLELLREGLADRLESGLADGQVQRATGELIADMTAGMDAITAVIAHIRTVFKDNAASSELVDVHAVIRSAARSLPPEVQGDVAVRNQVDPQLVVVAHPADLYIIARNLITNAVDACADVDDPLVRVRSERSDAVTRVLVEDNGRGMSAQELNDCFDPFYTTKSNGGGMGVGLALCKAIADRTGNRILIQSTPSHGTTVTYEILEERS